MRHFSGQIMRDPVMAASHVSTNVFYCNVLGYKCLLLQCTWIVEDNRGSYMKVPFLDSSTDTKIFLEKLPEICCLGQGEGIGL